MKKQLFNEILGLIFLSGLILISGCDDRRILTSGILEGTISIGPICPVERIPPDPACMPTAETYNAYPVSIFTSDGKKKIAQLNPSLDGFFSTELPSGTYQVVLEKSQNNIGGSNLPLEVTIISEGKTMLNIDIDTGIR